jgi:hypothetical protein
MAAPGKKFSWNRLLTNMVPNFARDDPNDVDLKPEQADNLVGYQLLSPHLRYLNESAFFVAGIVGTKSLSKKVHKSLVKHKIILPVPEAEVGEGEQMTVTTAAVTKHFASQLAIISVHAQRKLVGLLFFWEEELMRWKMLDAEEKEILGALETEGGTGNKDLEVALEAVEMKKKLLPSQRGEETANVGKGRGHELPSYA